MDIAGKEAAMVEAEALLLVAEMDAMRCGRGVVMAANSSFLQSGGGGGGTKYLWRRGHAHTAPSKGDDAGRRAGRQAAPPIAF